MAKGDGAARNTGPLTNSQWLKRPRLLEPLAQAEDKRLIALLAPAGYGKTTLLKQHMEYSPRQTMWLTLRDDAAIASNLARDTMFSLNQIIPKLRFPQTNKALNIRAQPNRIGTTLARDLNALKINLNLVFDRIEHLSESSASLLQALIEEIGEGHQVFVAGYEGNPLSVARFTIDGMALTLEASQLNFTPEETAAFLTAQGFQGNIQEAHKRMDGWSLGVAMAANSGADTTQPNQVISGLLQKLPKPLQDWLPELSVLDVWSIELARNVGCKLPNDWFGTVTKIGLPLVALSPLEYQPHSLLNETLRNLLKISDQRHRQLSLNAGKIAEKQKKVFEAVRHYYTGGLLKNAVKIMEKFMIEIRSTGDFSLFQKVLNIVPETELPNKVQIFVNANKMYTTEASEGKRRLIEMYHSGNRDPELILSLAVFSQRSRDANEMLQYTDELMNLNNLESDQIRRALAMKADAYDILGDLEKSRDFAKKSLKVAKEAKNYLVLAAGLGNLGVTYQKVKNYPEAYALYQKAHKYYELTGANKFLAINFHNILDLHIQSGNYSAFENMFHEVLKFTKNLGDYWNSPSLYMKFMSDFYQGKILGLEKTGETAIACLEKTSRTDMLHSIRSTLIQTKILSEKLTEAKELLQIYLKMPCENYQEPRKKFVSAILEFSLTHFDVAEALFSELESHSSKIGPLNYCRLLTYRAEIARRGGKPWRNLIDEAFDNLTTLGYDTPLKIDRPLLQGLYDECIRRNFYRERIQKALKITQPSENIVNLKINIQALEKSIFLIGKDPLKIGLQKSKELFIWLAIQGASSRFEIINALWGSDTSQNREYFKIAVRKLRTALLENTNIKVDPILFENGLYQLHSSIEPQWDFKLLINRFHENRWTDTDIEKTHTFPIQFLKGMTADWIQDFKQGTINSLYSALMSALEQVEEASRVINLCEAAIALDPLSEAAYAVLSKHLRRIGKAEEAKLVSMQFKSALES
jgi:LuxR family transcriptional regulator, maltose regulon positive regulatory protein